MRFTKVLMLTAIVLVTTGFFMNDISAAPKNKERGDIDEKYKWNLADLYETKSDWEKAKDEIIVKIEKISDYKGKLGKSAKDLYNGLTYYFDVQKEFWLI